MPLLDVSGAEIPIYTEQGRRIPRRIPLFHPARKPAGILVALDRVHDFFFQHPTGWDEYDSDEGDDNHPRHHPDIFLYPQAFLKVHGHVQANCIPVPLQQVLREMNAKMAMPITTSRGDDDSDADSDDVSDEPPTPYLRTALTGISTQMYGDIMHRTRPTARQHDAQLGTITQAFAGSHAVSAKNKRVATQKFEACKLQLPHARYQQRIDNPDIPTDLRLEYVCRVTIANLKPEFRDGR